MAIAVNDANIFIDLFEIDLIDTFFKLKLDLHTTNLVMNELDFEQKTVLEKQVAKKKLTVKKLNETELEDVKRKEITSTKLTKQDVSVYAYAKELNATILTSDNRLRKEAKAKGFEVHGILWVFETMMQEKLMKPKKASEKLTELMKINTWLPMEECRKRIEKWNNL